MDRAHLRTCLDTLDDAVPPLRSSSPSRMHFRAAFARMAEAIRDGARTPADAAFVSRRLEEILSWHGLEDAAADDRDPGPSVHFSDGTGCRTIPDLP